jgi:hypothetical protein
MIIQAYHLIGDCVIEGYLISFGSNEGLIVQNY